MNTFFAIVTLDKKGPFATFEEVCLNFFPRMDTFIAEEPGEDLIRTTCSIEYYVGGETKTWSFYEVWHIAHELKVLVNGRFASPPPTITQREFIQALWIILGEKVDRDLEDLLNQPR